MDRETRDKAKWILLNRQKMYQVVFNEESIFAKRVLKDLARFCKANETTFHEDPRIHAVLEGRREVFLRILNHINLTSEQFLKKFGKDLE